MSIVDATASAAPDGTDTPALEARNVTVRFGGLVAVSDVSLEVPPASIVGLVGPNGAGKTTLFNVFSGLLRPQEGDVYLGGRKVTGAAPSKRSRLGLARTFQQLELFMGLTVREHVILGYRVRNQRRRLWSDLLTAGSLHRTSDAERARVEHLIDLLDLRSVADTSAAVLPLGTARRVEVARALATGPSVVLLDEPSSGLDGHETANLGAALRTVADEEKISLLLVEHDVAMVLGLSSSVAVLDFGVRIAYGSPEEIRSDPTVRAAYLGDDEAVEGTALEGAPADDTTEDREA